MVPEGWEVKPLSEIAKEKISYGIVQAGPHVPDGVPYIKSSDVRGIIEPDDLQRTSTEIHYKYRRSAVHPGDIVFSLRGNIGESAIVPPELPEANLTQGTARISVSERHSNRFHFYQLASAPLLNRVNALSKGSTFKEISLEELRKVRVLCSPLPEQKKIAQILSTWDQAISATERLLENSQQRKKGLMQQLLTGKKRLPGFEGEWRFISFTDGFSVVNQKSSQVKSSEYQLSGSIPIIDQGQNEIAGYCEHDSPYTDLPVVIFGDHTRALKWVDFPFCPGADGTQVLKAKPILNEKFAYFVLSHVELPNLGYSRHMRELKQREFKVPVEIEEQRQIAITLTTADSEIRALSHRLHFLKQEKKALMQQLLTGKCRVRVDTEAA